MFSSTPARKDFGFSRTSHTRKSEVLFPGIPVDAKLTNAHHFRYYLTNAEIEVLEKYADNMAERIPSGSLVVELGSG